MLKSLHVLLFVSFVGLLSAQDNCSGFYPFKERAVMEYTNYDKKQKVNSKVLHEITVVDEIENGYEAQVGTKTYDKVGELLSEGTFQISCVDNSIRLDAISMMSPELTNAFSNFEVTISGEELVIPSELEVGQSLPDANNVIQASSNDINLLKFNYSLTNRKVEAKETIETEAGSFECYKVTYELFFKAVLSKNLMVSEWYAKDVGIVKSVTFNKKGKEVSSMTLTKFEQG